MTKVRMLFSLALIVTLAASARAQGTRADYGRAAELEKRFRNKVFKAGITPHWFAENARFWYRNDTRDGQREFVVVDTGQPVRRPAFDHRRMAEALSKATGEQCEPARLPIERIEFLQDEHTLRFRAKDDWQCNLDTYALEKSAEPTAESESRRHRRGAHGPRGHSDHRGTTSPDGQWETFITDANLHLRCKETAEECVLTTDGTPEDGYSGRVYWSPDSRKLVAMRTKDGQHRKVYLIESSPTDQVQPKLHTREYAKPGDAVEFSKPHLFDVKSKKEIPLADDLFSNPWSLDRVRWDGDGSRFTFYYNQRGHQVVRIIAVDAETGKATPIIDEQSKTFICYSGKQFLHFADKTDEIIWASERDGWNHLYLYDAKTGEVKNQITKGPWVMRGVERVDEEKRQIWFRAGGIRPGQDPYYIHYCRVNFDGSDLIILTEGDGTHSIRYSPEGKFLIDTYSRVDMAPVTELRLTADGSLVCQLEKADCSALTEAGWQAPEPFTAKGRDGETDIHGVIFRPTNFDPEKKVPIIEKIYAGPHGAFVPKAFKSYHSAQSMSELGFILVRIDGMGTSHRSKAFHDVCFQDLADSGFPDRVLWIKAAAAKYPQMDLTRIGIYGGSAGGQSSTRALLDYPEFYKVAVSDAGCHDNRMDKIWWNEQWMGWPVGPHYAECSNVTYAHKLQGKLLLIVGEMDTNVPPASTLQVVNALIKADKDFDLLFIPGAGHGVGGRYGERRRADYFVRHLLGVEPRTEP